MSEFQQQAAVNCKGKISKRITASLLETKVIQKSIELIEERKVKYQPNYKV